MRQDGETGFKVMCRYWAEGTNGVVTVELGAMVFRAKL